MFLIIWFLIAINSFVLVMDTHHVTVEVGSDYYTLFRWNSYFKMFKFFFFPKQSNAQSAKWRWNREYDTLNMPVLRVTRKIFKLCVNTFSFYKGESINLHMYCIGHVSSKTITKQVKDICRLSKWSPFRFFLIKQYKSFYVEFTKVINVLSHVTLVITMFITIASGTVMLITWKFSIMKIAL